MEIEIVKTPEEARDQTIEWQNWFSNNAMSWSDLVDWGQHFEDIAIEFDLVDEFKENGII